MSVYVWVAVAVAVVIVWLVGRTAVRSFRTYVRNLWPH